MKKVIKRNYPLLKSENLDNLIQSIRSQRVILDSDLAIIYGTTTKALNQAVKRNIGRFPADFMIKLNSRELSKLVTDCDRFALLKHSSSKPYAFTEHGALMLASVLNSDVAIKASISIVRAFVRMRALIKLDKDLKSKLKLLERKISKHDDSFEIVFETLNNLLTIVDKGSKKVGFHVA